jgi:hypothetical protein
VLLCYVVGFSGADSSFLTTGECVSSLLSAFTHCAQSYAMPSPFYNIPFAHTLFSQPTQRMSHIMATLRQRIGLPPAPLHQGIRDQAHFVLALQFRNSPIGVTIIFSLFLSFNSFYLLFMNDNLFTCIS